MYFVLCFLNFYFIFFPSIVLWPLGHSRTPPGCWTRQGVQEIAALVWWVDPQCLMAPNSNSAPGPRSLHPHKNNFRSRSKEASRLLGDRAASPPTRSGLAVKTSSLWVFKSLITCDVLLEEGLLRIPQPSSVPFSFWAKQLQITSLWLHAHIQIVHVVIVSSTFCVSDVVSSVLWIPSREKQVFGKQSAGVVNSDSSQPAARLHQAHFSVAPSDRAFINPTPLLTFSEPLTRALNVAGMTFCSFSLNIEALSQTRDAWRFCAVTANREKSCIFHGDRVNGSRLHTFTQAFPANGTHQLISLIVPDPDTGWIVAPN